MLGERNNSIIEMSLTELAFIFFFILLIFSAWKISSTSDELKLIEEEHKQLTEKVQNLKESLEAATALAVFSEESDPAELFQELTAGRKAVEQLRITSLENVRLEEQLDSLAELVSGGDPDQGLDEQVKQYQERLQVFEDAGLGIGKSSVEVIAQNMQQHSDFKEQNINLRKRLKNLGNGLDHPPCWTDPVTGGIQYVFDVIINENFVEFKPSWPESRSEQALANHNITRISGRYASNKNMWRKTQALFAESEQQECRHFVRIYDHADSKRAFKLYLLGIENHFYKYLSRRENI